MQKDEIGSFSYTIHKHTKINSKWIINLTIEPKTIKFLEESLGDKLLDIGLSDNFFVFETKA